MGEAVGRGKRGDQCAELPGDTWPRRDNVILTESGSNGSKITL
jgi:hypothetical protein